MSEPARLTPIMAGGRCIGHVVRSARGAVACDAKDAQIGTYSTAELAIDAITRRTVGAGKGDL
jgi:hypothetical protein